MNNSAPNYPPLRYLSPWHRATRQLAAHLHARSASVGAPLAESHLISYLGSYAPVPIGRLVQVFGLNKSTLTGMLDRLETAGLAQRTLNPADRRSFLVDLTEDGRAVAARLRRQLEAVEAAIEAELTPDDRAAFARIMTAIARITGHEAPAADPGAPAAQTAPTAQAAPATQTAPTDERD